MQRAPDEEEFEAWRDNPVTQWVLEAYAILAAEQKAAWVDMSWESGEADELRLIELRTRADAYQSMAESVLEDLITTHNPEVPNASL